MRFEHRLRLQDVVGENDLLRNVPGGDSEPGPQQKHDSGFAREDGAIPVAREDQPGERGNADAHGHRKIVSDAPGEAMRIEIRDPGPHQQAEIGPEEAERNRRENNREDDVITHLA